jgi:putative oxidoreductase
MLAMRTVPYAAFLLRVSLGILFLAHGAMKLFVFTPAGTVEFFASLGLPPALAYLTMLAELGGGALLLAGVVTRWAALALVPLMLGTINFDHGASGWVFSNPGGGWEFPAFWTVTLIVQALLGDGAFALRVPFLRMRPAHAI